MSTSVAEGARKNPPPFNTTLVRSYEGVSYGRVDLAPSGFSCGNLCQHRLAEIGLLPKKLRLLTSLRLLPSLTNDTCVFPLPIPKEVRVERFNTAIPRRFVSALQRAARRRPRRRRTTAPWPSVPDPRQRSSSHGPNALIVVHSARSRAHIDVILRAQVVRTSLFPNHIRHRSPSSSTILVPREFHICFHTILNHRPIGVGVGSALPSLSCRWCLWYW